MSVYLRRGRGSFQITNDLSNVIRQPFGLDLSGPLPPPPAPSEEEMMSGETLREIALGLRERAAGASARARQAERALQLQEKIANLAAVAVAAALLIFFAKKLLDWFRG
jgi:hypothetical protein